MNTLHNRQQDLFGEILFYNEITDIIDNYMDIKEDWFKAYVIHHSMGLYGIRVPGASIGHIQVDPATGKVLEVRLYEHAFEVVFERRVPEKLASDLSEYEGYSFVTEDK